MRIPHRATRLRAQRSFATLWCYSLAVAGVCDAAAQDTTAQRVGDGTISGTSVFRGTFTPDGDTLYFFRSVGQGEDYRIFRSTRGPSGWTEPTPLTIGGEHSDLYPTISADGRRMVFASYRPVPGVNAPRQAHLWLVERGGDGGWGEPRFLREVSTLGWYHSHPRILPDGRLEYARQTAEYREKTMFVAQPTGDGYAAADTLPAWAYWVEQAPDGYHLFDVVTAPDGSYALLAVGERPNPQARPGPSDLWIAWREGDGWLPAVRIEADVNTPAFENFPFWSPSGRELYFVRDFATLYRLPVSSLPAKR